MSAQLKIWRRGSESTELDQEKGCTQSMTNNKGTNIICQVLLVY